MGSETGQEGYGGLGTSRPGTRDGGNVAAAAAAAAAAAQSSSSSDPDVPPPPPPKDLPPLPAEAAKSLPKAVLASASEPPSEPPKRPLPPTPSVKSSASSLKPPATARTPPIRPQEPLSMNPPTRPATAATQTSGVVPIRLATSTKRLSWTTLASRRQVKYAQGKFGRVELVPQPSDDPDDPLNWPAWRKELHFWSLLVVVAMTGVTKTILMTVNAELAELYDRPYKDIAALTGVPLILSFFTGFLCLAASRVCGKRPLYLASFLLVFIGTIWNTNVARSYAECMAARVFQGLGWGAFDTLVLGSIQDTYFEHERNARVAIHSVVAVATTWGPPLLGGVASQGPGGFQLQFTVLSSFFFIAIPAVALGIPETTFDRKLTFAQTPATGASQFKSEYPPSPRRLLSVETIVGYLAKLKPYGYRGPADLAILLQAPRAFVSPTTALLAVLSLLPTSSLWGLSSSLSLALRPFPFALRPGVIGAMFLAPFLLATAVVAASSLLPHWQQPARFTPKFHASVVAAGSFLAFLGTLVFGLHLTNSLPLGPGDGGAPVALPGPDETGVSVPALSFALGMLAAGAALLESTAPPLVRASAAYTAANLAANVRNTADMAAGVACWRALFAGAFAIAVPRSHGDVRGYWQALLALRGFCIGSSISLAIVGATVASVWWLWGAVVRRWDGLVMGQVDLEALKAKNGSFFDTD
ncbi:hypothetical protein VTJ83DRAFT_4409 [Remersonia thermophila]|uniref:Major facilitator superfamily (MFS) profile domain-containing protein n=1 Tax=Remersonia thermophila TaxID=72144 RepID=A0ABR4DA23_9PEZI